MEEIGSGVLTLTGAPIPSNGPNPRIWHAVKLVARPLEWGEALLRGKPMIATRLLATATVAGGLIATIASGKHEIAWIE